MASQDKIVFAPDKTRLFVRHWFVSVKPLAVVHIVHGMAEHCLRYTPLAHFLIKHNISVIAHDQRGHGRSTVDGLSGFFGNEKGWDLVVNDIDAVQEQIVKSYPDTPIILLGHSMGSFVCQSYLATRSHKLAGCILSGSDRGSRSLYQLLRFIVKTERFRQGKKAASALVNFLVFGRFNRAFKPRRTPFDWLSRDQRQVDLYLKDPYCGKRSTNQLWLDFLDGMIDLCRPDIWDKLPASFPICILGGHQDPLSGGQRLPVLAQSFISAGVQNLDVRIYPGCRHEVFNEINRREVFEDILSWIFRNVSNPESFYQQAPAITQT